jgi:hypothetical protein
MEDAQISADAALPDQLADAFVYRKRRPRNAPRIPASGQSLARHLQSLCQSKPRDVGGIKRDV